MAYFMGSILKLVQTRRLFATLSVVIIATLVLGACGGGTPAAPSKYNGKISVGLDSDVVTLDPLASSAFVDRQLMLNIYDTLVRSMSIITSYQIWLHRGHIHRLPI